MNNWDSYFLGMCHYISTKSPDAQTKHGAVLVNEHKQIIGTGFNGFPRGVNDGVLPRTRPDKYPWIIHAEINALHNSQMVPWGERSKCTMYITGPPCLECIKDMHQWGISLIKHGNVSSVCMQNEPQRKQMILETNIKIIQLDQEVINQAKLNISKLMEGLN